MEGTAFDGGGRKLEKSYYGHCPLKRTLNPIGHTYLVREGIVKCGGYKGQYTSRGVKCRKEKEEGKE